MARHRSALPRRAFGQWLVDIGWAILIDLGFAVVVLLLVLIVISLW
jgi:hypothetical protein